MEEKKNKKNVDKIMFLEMKMSIFKFRKSEKEFYKGKKDFF